MKFNKHNPRTSQRVWYGLDLTYYVLGVYIGRVCRKTGVYGAYVPVPTYNLCVGTKNFQKNIRFFQGEVDIVLTNVQSAERSGGCIAAAIV